MGSLRGEGVVMSNYGLLLDDHVTLRCRSIDRIFLQAYVPLLQAVGEVCTFLRRLLGEDDLSEKQQKSKGSQNVHRRVF